MNENEFILEDRISKIRSINDLYDLEHNGYLSFSGGKDSTILHYLIDIALPGNHIPRVFINTGIEYRSIVDFVKSLQEKDERVVILPPTQNIRVVLEENGYPFKSKQHSHDLAIFQRNGSTITSEKYLGNIESSTKFRCPKLLQFQFQNNYQLKISDKCCEYIKKKPAKQWEKENNKEIIMTGMRAEESGQRASIGCIVTDKENNLKKFHPLLVVSEEWENWFIENQQIKLCGLYYQPYGFKRTGCKGCPFSLNLQHDLDTMEKLLPNEKAQCENIWQPIYKEYRRLGYRLRKDGLE
jgi:3'-phosphoadenosine 5'-phosphosulfate sulfotransferase (PAPS reductase)/FAD synthetase